MAPRDALLDLVLLIDEQCSDELLALDVLGVEEDVVDGLLVELKCALDGRLPNMLL